MHSAALLQCCVVRHARPGADSGRRPAAHARRLARPYCRVHTHTPPTPHPAAPDLTRRCTGHRPSPSLAQVAHAPTRQLVLRSRCAKTATDARPDTRPLNLIAPAGTAWPIHCDDDDNSRALCAVVRRVAVDRAVMAAVSNQNILPMLGQFVDIVKQVAGSPRHGPVHPLRTLPPTLPSPKLKVRVQSDPAPGANHAPGAARPWCASSGGARHFPPTAPRPPQPPPRLRWACLTSLW